jgi:AraC-like DNA-binding protein
MTGDRTLADVAYEVGFADQAHFTRTFKAALGLTPARYRALTTSRVGPAPS